MIDHVYCSQMSTVSSGSGLHYFTVEIKQALNTRTAKVVKHFPMCSEQVETCSLLLFPGTRADRGRYARHVWAVQHQSKVLLQLHSLYSWWSLLHKYCWLDLSFYDRCFSLVDMAPWNNIVHKLCCVVYTVLKQSKLSLTNKPVCLLTQWERIILSTVFPGCLWALDVKNSISYLNITMIFDFLFFFFLDRNTVWGLKIKDYCYSLWWW